MKFTKKRFWTFGFTRFIENFVKKPQCFIWSSQKKIKSETQKKMKLNKLKQHFESYRGGVVGKIISDYIRQKSEPLIKRAIALPPLACRPQWKMQNKENTTFSAFSKPFYTLK